MSWRLVSKRASLTALTFAIVAACAEDEVAAPRQPPAPDAGDASALDPIDGNASDAGADAGEADAEVPSCSKEGWCPIALPSIAKGVTLDSAWGDGQGVVWAVSREGDILRWDGQVWTVARSGTDRLFQIWGTGPTDLWVTSEAGILHARGASSASLTWTLTPLDALPGDRAVVLKSIGGTSASDVWAAGGRMVTDELWNQYSIGRVVHLAKTADGGDAGTSWVLEPSLSSSGEVLPPAGPSSVDWERVVGTATGELYLFGAWIGSSLPEGAVAAHSLQRRRREVDGTTTWDEMYGRSIVSSPTDYKSPCGRFRIFAGQYDANFKYRPVALAALGNEVWLASAGELEFQQGYAVGTFDSLTHSTSWSCGSFGYGDSMFRNALFVSTESDAWAAGDYGRLSHYDGQSWRTVAVTPQLPNPADFNDVWAGPQDVWVVGTGIALRKVKP